MPKAEFTDKQIQELENNPNTSYVSRHVIRFTLEFKSYFVENYKAGVHPHLIFKQCGYDPDVIGPVRIKHFTHRVQSEDLAATTLKPRKPHKAFDAAKAYEEPLDMTVLRMQNEITYLQQEIAFIKKIIESDRSSKRRK